MNVYKIRARENWVISGANQYHLLANSVEEALQACPEYLLEGEKVLSIEFVCWLDEPWPDEDESSGNNEGD